MARIDWVEQRLRNWALWHERGKGGGLGFASRTSFLADVASRGQPLEVRIPVDEVEAGITDEGVQALRLVHLQLHDTLHYYYLSGSGVQEISRIQRRAVSTIHAQLGQADAWLATWFTERKRRKAEEAEALRQQIEAGRPAKLQGVVLPAPRVGRLRRIRAAR